MAAVAVGTSKKQLGRGGETLELALDFPPPATRQRLPLPEELAAFKEFGTATQQTTTEVTDQAGDRHKVPTFINEFWTARQRQAHSLHEVSYRACFKPQLPRFFIERLTQPGEVVYDPFLGRGTTPLEAALLGRVPYGCDINPLSQTLIRPRLNPPALASVADRLNSLSLHSNESLPEELGVFYHAKTLEMLVALRRYLLDRKAEGKLDPVDEWIALVALNRLTGHSPGFFSVYTLPPNQAVSVKSQARINARRGQTPEPRDVRAIILKKSRSLLKDCTAAERQRLGRLAAQARILTAPADRTPKIPDSSVALVVTSPPFLDVVQYATDNWLRCWFLGIDPAGVNITQLRKLEDWRAAMTRVFHELARVLQPGGHVAFEVGEVHAGATRLEETVIPCGLSAGLKPLLILINDQEFTKTANCWGVDNMAKGTNTNRIVLFTKPA